MYRIYRWLRKIFIRLVNFIILGTTPWEENKKENSKEEDITCIAASIKGEPCKACNGTGRQIKPVGTVPDNSCPATHTYYH